MFHFRNYFLILFCFIMFLLTSCGLTKKNDTNNNDVHVEISPELGVTALAPKDVLYIPSPDQQDQIKQKNSSIFSLRSNTIKTTIYRSTGNGGLGDDLNDIDSLNPYEGIPLDIIKDGVEPVITISADGDKGCSNLFTYIDNDNLIKIDSTSVSVLTICDITISAAGVTKAGNTLTQSATFSVSINPTMKAYANKNDPTFKYLQVYSALNDTRLIAKWIKDPNQGANLVLKYDLTKAIKVGSKLVDANVLTGAQNLKSLDLSGTDLKNLNAVVLLKNLERLDISGTKVDPKDLTLLSQMPNLKALAVRNMNIKDITFITNNLKNLTELDISNNDQIENLDDIKNLQNLTTLKASDTGISDLKELTNFTQLKSLDLSNNDLSKLKVDDVQLLVNLYNIYELNLSYTHISDAFLNAYFNKIGDRNFLRKLIIRNKSSNGDVDCKNVNIFSNIVNLANLTNLEYLDLHGNGCSRNDYNYFLDGLKNTFYFSGMVNLNYLDISATGVNELSGIINKSNLRTLKLYDPEGGGISMTKDACLAQFSNFNECYKLGNGTAKSAEYKSATSTTFIIPPNVYSVKVTGCSGGDGGSGGQGGQGGTSGSLPFDVSNGDYNYTKCRDGFQLSQDQRYCWANGAGGAGGSSGGQGGLTSIAGLFSTTQETYYSDLNGNCGAGSAGSGGSGGGVHCGWWGHCELAPQPASGRSGSTGQNKKFFIQNFAVTPGQVLNINIGKGGKGGAGGAGGIFGYCAANDEGKLFKKGPYACAWRGITGGSGGNGTDGYLKIDWQQ
jgi:Leucine-rich repeat (LRR) protein